MIFDRIRNKVIRFLKAGKSKDKVRIFRNCTVNNTIFEGKNTIYSNSIICNSAIGLCTYIGDGAHISNTRIGRFCSVAENVKVAIGNHPTSVFVTTFPSFYYNTNSQIGYTFHKGKPLFDGLKKFPDGENKYQVVIGHDVWIGTNSIIMGGVKIGDGAIIGAGAVITKDVAPFSVVAGVPAKVIKYRFTEKQIQFLERIRWWEWPIEKIEKEYMAFTDINEFITKFGKYDDV